MTKATIYLDIKDWTSANINNIRNSFWSFRKTSDKFGVTNCFGLFTSDFTRPFIHHSCTNLLDELVVLHNVDAVLGCEKHIEILGTSGKSIVELSSQFKREWTQPLYLGAYTRVRQET